VVAAATVLRSSVRSTPVGNDVRQGYVSVEAAAELYGVVVDPITLDVNKVATERLRAARR